MRTDANPSPLVQSQLRKKKKNAEKKGKEFKVFVPTILDPRAAERALVKEYKQRYRELLALVDEMLINRIDDLLDRDSSEKPKTDALADDVFVIINGIKVEFERRFSPSRVRNKLKDVGGDVEVHNKGQINKVFRSTVGVDVFKSEPWLQPQVENFIEQNVGLIKAVDEKYMGEIQEIVFRGARTGMSTKDIAAEIRKRGKIADGRAEGIARDQIQKFNGQLAQLRQVDLGVRRYRWRTALDERVREEHSRREGKIFSWDDPPDDGHPGEPINCRCYAEPVLEDLI